MSLSDGKWKKYIDQYPEVASCTTKSKSMRDSLPCYKCLYEFKPKIPKELYVYYFRKLLEMNTGKVSKELRLKMFDGVSPDDIMYQDELDEIEDWEDYITVYRGATKDEDIPGLSWSKYKWVAEDYYKGKLFEAQIPKNSILLYYAHNSYEGEIIANVTSGYKVIKED